MNVATFPWNALDSIRRADVATLATMRRAVSRYVDAAAAEGALRELIGPCDLAIRLRRVASSPPRIDESAVGVLLAPGERADRRRSFAVLLEQALAGAAVSRALRRPAVRVVDPTRTPTLPGAIAALLVAAARRSAPAPLRVLAAGPAHAVLGEIVALDPVPVGATFTVLLDHDAYLVHVFAPRSALEPAPAPDLDTTTLSALGATPLEVPLVAGVLTMTVDEVAALEPGDALAPLTLTRTAAGFAGDLLLAPPASDVGFAADLGDGGRLVLREGPLPLAAEESMVDKDALAQSIGETPVVVRVEVGSAQMSAREWASLGAGDIVGLGKRIGEHVVLRVGGAEVARGELVDLEGEIGVRIVARAGGTVA